MTILALDPGTTLTGYAIIQMPDFKLLDFGKEENTRLLEMCELIPYDIDEVAIEMIACYGMPAGKDIFETCVWIGQFKQALKRFNITYIYRKDEKITLCNSMKAKDSNIRQALINRYAKHDYKNGKGTKKNKDIFYGVSKDVWSAIAVGVTYYETKERGFL